METVILTLGSILFFTMIVFTIKELLYIGHRSFIMYMIERQTRLMNQNFIKENF